MLAKVGVAVFPSSGKTPLIPMFNKLDTAISAEDRAAAIGKYKEAHRDKKPVHVGATTNSSTIKKMWRAFPDAVPSIATGPSRMAVLDADSKDQGPEKMTVLWEANGGRPKGSVETPTKSNGTHAFFSDPEGRFTNKAGLLKSQYGTDVRGTGGQVVAPGSMLPDGRSYGTRKDLTLLLRAIHLGTLPLVPDYIEKLIGAQAPHKDDVAPSKEREVIKALEEADWDKYEAAFDPTIGDYDIDKLRADNAQFKELYDNPSSDCSTNRFFATRHVMREWPDLPAPALSIFFSQWEGAGAYTDEKPKSGEYDDRQIAREWLKNQGFSRPSNGDAFGAVVDEEESDSKNRTVVHVDLNNPAALVLRVEDILIKRDAQIFRRGSTLVEVVSDRPLPGLDNTMPTVQLLPLNIERLGQLTGRLIDFRRWDKRARGFLPCPPPGDLMKHLMARGVRSSLRRINFVATAPMIRPDGSILSAPGYDVATEVYLAGNVDLPALPDNPTRDDGLEALKFAAVLFSECAFADKDQGYPFTSVGLSAVLSVLVAGMSRLLISGIPMLTCAAATPGSGKSFIGRLLGIWLTGRDIPVSNVAAGSSGELDKRLNAGLLGGAPMVHLDNCNGRLVSDLLCQILTERTVAVRPLGVSEEVNISGMPMVLANGNNVQVDENLARRTLMVELDAGMERPELRNFNLRPDGMLRADRGAYIAAILTAIRAFLLALSRGDAKSISPSAGSFNDWSDYARSMLVWYGFRDPIEAMAIAQVEDPEKAARASVFKGLFELFQQGAFTVGKIIERIHAAEYDALEERPTETAACQSLRDNLKGLLPKGERCLTPQTLGTLFRGWATKVEAGLKLHRLERNAANVTTYAVRPC